jgi:hypothetical protein
MIALANERGGHDNETAIVADLRGEGLDPPDEFETVTSTYEVLQAYESTIKVAPAEPELPDLSDLPDAVAEPAPEDTAQLKVSPRRRFPLSLVAVVVVVLLIALFAIGRL